MSHEGAVIHSLLGAGTRYEGKLFFDGRVRIDGDFEGEVHSDGVLIVGEQASIKGSIHVHTLIVRGGSIEGDVLELVLPKHKCRGNGVNDTLR